MCHIGFLAFSGFGLIQYPTNEFWPTPTDNALNLSRCLLSQASLANWQVSDQTGEKKSWSCLIYEPPPLKSVALPIQSGPDPHCRGYGDAGECNAIPAFLLLLRIFESF